MGQASLDDIVSNQGPVAAAAPSAGGTAHVDDIVSNQGPETPAAPTADQKFNQPFQHTPQPPIDPPQDHKEELVKSVGGAPSLAAYRAARKAVEGVEMMIKAPSESYDAAKEIVKNLGTDMVSNAKANFTEWDPNHGQMYQTPIVPGPGVSAALENPMPEAATAAKVAPVAAPVAPAAASPTTWLKNPWQKTKEFIQSPKDAKAAATQEPGISAVRNVTGGTGPLVDRAAATTAADDMLQTRGVAKTAEYKKIDDLVGFDRKAEMKKLSDTQYAIKQPGADVMKLQDEIDASTQRLTEADAKLAKAKIDPKVADNLNTSWEATKSFKNDLIQSTNADGTVNVDMLIKRAKSRFNPKYGDRLAQAFGNGDSAAGKPIANAYVKGLEAAQKAGVKAASTQTFRRFVAGIAGDVLGISAGSTAIYEGAKWWLGN